MGKKGAAVPAKPALPSKEEEFENVDPLKDDDFEVILPEDKAPGEEENPNPGDDPGGPEAGGEKPGEQVELDENGNPIEETPDAGEEDADIHETVTQLVKENKELRENQRKIEQGIQSRHEAPKERTDTEWLKLEETWGVGRSTITAIEQQNANMIRAIVGYIGRELGGLKKNEALQALSKQKGFEDLNNYRAGIDEFLAEFEPGNHSDPQLLKKAYYYGKGVSAQKKIDKVIQSKEGRRRIIKNAGGAPAGASNKAKRTITLTREQMAMADKAGMNYKEYAKYLQPISAFDYQ